MLIEDKRLLLYLCLFNNILFVFSFVIDLILIFYIVSNLMKIDIKVWIVIIKWKEIKVFGDVFK